jgi:hypothetical protein
MMIELGPDIKIEISLSSAEPASHNVMLTLPAGHCPVVHLSTQQARTLANEIIKAVNKAEVRTNLQTANNMRRNDALQASRLQNEIDALRKPPRPTLVHS